MEVRVDIINLTLSSDFEQELMATQPTAL